MLDDHELFFTVMQGMADSVTMHLIHAVATGRVRYLQDHLAGGQSVTIKQAEPAKVPVKPKYLGAGGIMPGNKRGLELYQKQIAERILNERQRNGKRPGKQIEWQPPAGERHH